MGKYSTWERKKLTRRTCYNHATFLILAWPRGGKLSELVGVINLNKIQVLFTAVGVSHTSCYVFLLNYELVV